MPLELDIEEARSLVVSFLHAEHDLEREVLEEQEYVVFVLEDRAKELAAGSGQEDELLRLATRLQPYSTESLDDPSSPVRLALQQCVRVAAESGNGCCTPDPNFVPTFERLLAAEEDALEGALS